MIDTRNFYIDGAWVAPLEGTDLPVFNPATEEPYATIPLGGAADAEAAIAAARRTFPSWSMTTPAERGEVLRAILAVYEARAADMAEAELQLLETALGEPVDTHGAVTVLLKLVQRRLDAAEEAAAAQQRSAERRAESRLRPAHAQQQRRSSIAQEEVLGGNTI